MSTLLSKKYLFLFLLFISSCIFSYKSFGQDTTIIRLKAELAKAKTDTDKIIIMGNFVEKYPLSDSALYFANNAVILSRKANSLNLESYCLQQLSNVLLVKNDLTNALETAIESLHIAETLNSERGKAMSEGLIGSIYEQTEDWQSSLNYEWKAYDGFKKLNYKYQIVGATMGIGYAYLGLNKLDSALFFENEAYEEIIGDTTLRNDNNLLSLLSSVNSDIGEIQIKLKNYNLALDYIRTSITEDKSNSGWDYYDISTIFKETGKTDSSIYYGKKSLAGAQKINSQKLIIISTALLSKLYQPINRDSAYTYLLLNQETNDSLFSQEKIQKAQSITFQQQLHEQEQEATKEHLADERNKNIEYAAIGLGIIAFIWLFIFLSPSITNPRFAKFLGILALLLVFEFIDLFIHPYIAGITNDSPFLMLLILVAIAAILIPLHNKVEHWLTHQLIEKNKKIQQKKMRKTVEKLQAKLNAGQ